MGIFSFGILLLLIGALSPFLIVIQSAITPHVNKTVNSKTVLGTTQKENPNSSSISANLTLNPPDQIDVVPVIIIEIIDIASVRVLLNDGMQIVDLIGVKVPSDTSQLRYEKCYGETIESAIQKMALGRKAYMIDDKEYDNDPNPQKYLFLDDLTFLNLELVKRGITSANITDGYLYRNEFADARGKAETNSIGVWYDTCSITPTPSRTGQALLTPNPKKTSKTIPTPTPTLANNLYSRLFVTSPPTPPPSPTVAPTTQPVFETNKTPSSKPPSLNSEILFVLINNHRKEIGKPAFEKDDYLCKLAYERGPELYDEIFVTRTVHSGLYNRNLPYWITENMAHYGSEEQVFNWWMGSTIHRKTIDGEEGCLQDFIEDGVDIDEVNVDDMQGELYKYWIFRHILRNPDGQNHNMLFKDGKIISIDHEASFDSDPPDPSYYDIDRSYYGVKAPDSLIEAFRSFLADESKQKMLRTALTGVINQRDIEITLQRLKKFGFLLTVNGQVDTKDELSGENLW